MNRTDDLIQIGFIRGAHALKGQVSVHVFSGNEEALTEYGSVFNADGSKTYDFRIDGVKQGDFLCSLKGVTDRNASEALKGTRLYVSASALPELDEDEFYYKDLIGMTALDAKGTMLGKVKNVTSFGPHDALDIEFIHTGEVELPKPQNEFVLFTKVNVPEVNIAAGTLTIELPFGTFEVPEKERS